MRLNTPPVLLGYQSSRNKISFAAPGGNQANSSKSETYLQVFATIEPQLQPAQPLAEKVKMSLQKLYFRCKYMFLMPLHIAYACTFADGRGAFI